MLRIILVLLFPILVFSQKPLSGKVVYVSDGDTFHLKPEEGKKIKIRVADIDCPERTQPFGLVAKAFVVEEIANSVVVAIIKDRDRYGREIAYIRYRGKDLSEELLKNGLAWHYKKYSDSLLFTDLEEEAREKMIGLWGQKEPVAPWDHRQSKSKAQ